MDASQTVSFMLQNSFQDAVAKKAETSAHAIERSKKHPDEWPMAGSRFLAVGVTPADTQGEGLCPLNPGSQLPGRVMWGAD